MKLIYTVKYVHNDRHWYLTVFKNRFRFNNTFSTLKCLQMCIINLLWSKHLQCLYINELYYYQINYFTRKSTLLLVINCRKYIFTWRNLKKSEFHILLSQSGKLDIIVNCLDNGKPCLHEMGHKRWLPSPTMEVLWQQIHPRTIPEYRNVAKIFLNICQSH